MGSQSPKRQTVDSRAKEPRKQTRDRSFGSLVRIQLTLSCVIDSTASTLMWPTIGGTPINEFSTEGYFLMAILTLFPTGAADFIGQRYNQLSYNWQLFQAPADV